MRWLALVIASWLGTVVLRATPLGGEWYALSAITWVALGGWLLTYIVGFTLVEQVSVTPRTATVLYQPVLWTRRWIAALCFFASVGAVLIVFEFAVLRGYGFGTSVVVIRLAEMDSATSGFGGSFISGAGRLLTPALQVAWLLAVMRWRELGAVKILLFAATAVVFWEQMMYEGGRFFLAALVLSCVFMRSLAASAAQMRGGNWPRRRGLRHGWLLTIVIGAVVMAAFGLVFLERATARMLDFSKVYLAFTESYDLDVGAEVVARLDGVLGALWFVVAMFWMYITQGFNELAVILDQSYFVHAFGLYEFPQLGQALSKFAGDSLAYDIFQHLPHVGTYSTFVGAAYIDFGLTGAILSGLVLGALTAASLKAIQREGMSALGLCAPLLVTLGVFSPIVSLVTNLWPALTWAIVVGSTARHRRVSPAAMQPAGSGGG